MRFQVLKAASIQMESSGMLRCVVWYKFTDVSEMITISLMTEAVSTSETSVNFYETTRRNITEDNHLP
jgi:hypothetical protein